MCGSIARVFKHPSISAGLGDGGIRKNLFSLMVRVGRISQNSFVIGIRWDWLEL